jgi:hypothetical protein
MGRSYLLILFGVVIVFFVTHAPVCAGGDELAFAVEDFEDGDYAEPYRSLYGRFVRNDTGTVVDRQLDFEWIVGPNEDTTWHEAKSWVERLSVEGRGWRMPTREELGTLYKEGAGSSNMSPSFKSKCRFAWTSEKVNSLHAWGFCFATGEAFWPRCSYSRGARAFGVRSLIQDNLVLTEDHFLQYSWASW